MLTNQRLEMEQLLNSVQNSFKHRTEIPNNKILIDHFYVKIVDTPSRNRCPAFGKSCSFYNKMNHFRSVCRSRLSHQTHKEHANKISSFTDKQIDQSPN